MRRYLLDANVVIAVVIAEHADHRRAQEWVAAAQADGAGLLWCPTVQGAAVRYLIRLGVTAADAKALIGELEVKFALLSENMSYIEVDMSHVLGHRQVTDAYLASLAARNDALLATFDKALAAVMSDRSVLIGSDE